MATDLFCPRRAAGGYRGQNATWQPWLDRHHFQPVDYGDYADAGDGTVQFHATDVSGVFLIDAIKLDGSGDPAGFTSAMFQFDAIAGSVVQMTTNTDFAVTATNDKIGVVSATLNGRAALGINNQLANGIAHLKITRLS